MKIGSPARIVFGASAILFGAIALMWWDADTWQNLHRIWNLPLGTVLGGCLMTAQIASGIAMQFPKTGRIAANILCVVYACFSLTCIASVIAAPSVYAQYGGFFEQFSLLSGALALYSSTETMAGPARTLVRAARLGLGVSAISFTLSQIIYFRVTANMVPGWIPPGQAFWAILTTAAFALAAIALLINRRARLAAQMLAVMLLLFGILVWIPRLIAHPETHENWSEFCLTCLIAGASWMVSDLKYH